MRVAVNSPYLCATDAGAPFFILEPVFSLYYTRLIKINSYHRTGQRGRHFQPWASSGKQIAIEVRCLAAEFQKDKEAKQTAQAVSILFRPDDVSSAGRGK